MCWCQHVARNYPSRYNGTTIRVSVPGVVKNDCVSDRITCRKGSSHGASYLRTHAYVLWHVAHTKCVDACTLRAGPVVAPWRARARRRVALVPQWSKSRHYASLLRTRRGSRSTHCWYASASLLRIHNCELHIVSPTHAVNVYRCSVLSYGPLLPHSVRLTPLQFSKQHRCAY